MWAVSRVESSVVFAVLRGWDGPFHAVEGLVPEGVGVSRFERLAAFAVKGG